LHRTDFHQISQRFSFSPGHYERTHETQLLKMHPRGRPTGKRV
jgi:hypothetical protein